MAAELPEIVSADTVPIRVSAAELCAAGALLVAKADAP